METTRFPHLFSEKVIRGKTFKNRIFYTPMGGLRVEDGEVWSYGTDIAAYKCAGGGAQFAVGETCISLKGGRGTYAEYDYFDLSEQNLAPFKKFTDLVHSHGMIVSTELVHCGDSKMESTEESPAMGPSGYLNHYGIPVRAMTKEEIAEACDEYGRAARFFQLVGFDSVIPHAGHGWLPQLFLSPRTNKRTDEYGGSIENRSRISVEIMQSIRKYCGEDLIIEVRTSCQELLEGSYSIDDYIDYCRCLAPYVDIIHVSCGHYRDPMHTRMMSTRYHDHGCNIHIGGLVKQAVGDQCCVCVVGGINSPEMAEAWIAEGKCDFVVLGRQSISDPAFAEKARTGREDEIIRCTRCLRCFPGPAEEAMLEGGLPDYCSIQPKWDRLELAGAPAAEPKKLLVVGGGPAGLQAAVTALERGHSVTLLEKGPLTGGWLNHTRNDDDKRDTAEFGDTLRRIAERGGADIRVNTELTPELLAELDPDAVFAAIGSEPIVPDIPGINRKNVMFAASAFAHGTMLGTKAVVIGAANMGCEAAIHLWKKGLHVTLVDDTVDAVCADGYRLHRQMVQDLVRENIPCHLHTRVTAITDGGVTAVTEDGTELQIPADMVVYAVGCKARDYSAIEQMAAGRTFRAIGDCVEARRVFEATSEGFEAAFDLGWGGYADYMAQFAMEEEPDEDE